MLSPNEPGAFILALANSMQDRSLRESLSPGLRKVFRELLVKRETGGLSGAPDDLVVFEALARRGIEGYGAWRHRGESLWRCTFNPLRALRPARSSAEAFSGLERSFDEKAFHFDKPFLKPETFGEEAFRGRPVRALFQKFPFVGHHLLLLPDPARHCPQRLDEATHRWFWALAETMGRNIPGFGGAYNSLGAGASVNHLHFHGFVQPDPFAVERGEWRHNGGEQPYPVSVSRHASGEDAWRMIAGLHAANQPYNLLYRPRVCYVVQRAPQSERTLPEWMETAGWQEVCGGFSLSDRTMFDSLTAHDIEQGLALLRP